MNQPPKYQARIIKAGRVFAHGLWTPNQARQFADHFGSNVSPAVIESISNFTGKTIRWPGSFIGKGCVIVGDGKVYHLSRDFSSYVEITDSKPLAQRKPSEEQFNYYF